MIQVLSVDSEAMCKWQYLKVALLVGIPDLEPEMDQVVDHTEDIVVDTLRKGQLVDSMDRGNVEMCSGLGQTQILPHGLLWK
jgi:hypothetical protein